jgi:hypothetical protein
VYVYFITCGSMVYYIGLKALGIIASGKRQSAVTVSWGNVSWVCSTIGVVRLIGMIVRQYTVYGQL